MANHYEIASQFSIKSHEPVSRADVRESTCVHCGEKFGGRKLAEVGDEASYDIVHSKCAEAYKQVLVRKATEAEEKAEAEAKAKRQAEREARVAKRGDLETYLESKPEGDDDEKRFWRVIKSAQRRIERADEAMAQFIAKLQKSQDPSYELSWSKDEFKVAAEKHVALRYAIEAFAAGSTLAQMREYVERDLLIAASSAGSHSTSPTSNLIDDFRIEALADLARAIRGDGFGW